MNRADESRTPPPILRVVGKKNSGKTTLVVRLCAKLVERGRRVMTVKHGHGFQLDSPGTDSWRHLHEGHAERVIMVGPERIAMVGGWGDGAELSLDEVVRRYLPDAELVVAEGYKKGRGPRIEVFRQAAHARSIYEAGSDDCEDYLAIVTDAPEFEAETRVLQLDDEGLVDTLADLVERTLLK